MKLRSSPLLSCSALLALVALAPKSGHAEPAPMRATAPAGVAKPAAPAPGAAAVPPGSGKVLETMNAATYTYARVETASGEQWIAGPQTTVAVGDTISWSGGNEMKNFPSKSLDRTFETILFVGRIQTGAAGAPAGAAGQAAGAAAPAAGATAAEAEKAMGASHGGLSGKGEGPEITGIEKVEGGQTVAEVYERRDALSGKEVAVRGQVVKFNAGVMGRNWLHLRDGSKSAAGENDLTVTTDQAVAVGDVVVVRGTVAVNKDFGFGYRYDVLVEGAKVGKD